MRRNPFAAKNKYGVAPAPQRTHNDKVYASKSEMIYAKSLELLQTSGDIIGFAEQPQVQLGPDTRYKPDFVVIEPGGAYFVDVKGMETPEFKKVKKLWAKYMNVALRVVKLKGDRFHTVEIVENHP